MKMSKSTLTPSQSIGVDMVYDWLERRKRQILRVGGPAGTGKTFFVNYLLKNVLPDLNIYPEDVYIVSYTGQAVNMLIQRDLQAKTIHSTFMKMTKVPLEIDGEVVKRGGIPIMVSRFKPVKSIPSNIKLIIIDESSFLPEDFEAMIAKYGVPILEIGDPIQLPPVVGKQCFNMQNLDHVLVEPMRQAIDSGILRLATEIRNGYRVYPSKFPLFGDVMFLKRKRSIEDMFYMYSPLLEGSDSIIVSTNKQRNIITQLYRENILGADSLYPMAGEKMICRKNNWQLCIDKYPLTNGTVGTVLDDVCRSDINHKKNTFIMDFKPDIVDDDYYDDLECDIDGLPYDYGKSSFGEKYKLSINKFEYAHAITAHLAQGSQYNNVAFFDSKNRDEEYHMRLKYTAVTRAQKKLYYFMAPFIEYI